MRLQATTLTRSLWLLAAVFTTACVSAPPTEAPRVEILTADARATSFGNSASAMLANPALRVKAQALFAADWTPSPAPGPASTGRISVTPAEFFEKSGPPRVVRVAGKDYIAAPGCQPRACTTLRGLLLVRADGEALLARLDEGGFAHYYGYGAGMAMTPDGRALLDSVWRALGPLP